MEAVLPTLLLTESLLTAAVPAVRVQSVVGGAAALRTGGRGQAQVGTVAIVEGTLIGAVLTGRVEDQDVHHQLQLTLRRQRLL